MPDPHPRPSKPPHPHTHWCRRAKRRNAERLQLACGGFTVNSGGWWVGGGVGRWRVWWRGAPTAWATRMCCAHPCWLRCSSPSPSTPPTQPHPHTVEELSPACLGPQQFVTTAPPHPSGVLCSGGAVARLPGPRGAGVRARAGGGQVYVCGGCELYVWLSYWTDISHMFFCFWF